MGFKAEVVLDSIGPNRKRLISVVATYPRFIHSELLTHRALARNSASSRAIPWKKLLPEWEEAKKDMSLSDYTIPLHAYTNNCMYAMIMNDPVIPISFGKEQKGMQSGVELDGAELTKAQKIWLRARDSAIAFADSLADLGVHKSICNRLTEPFMWITVLITATEWNNFFRLRCHPAAEKHFQKIAGMIREEINKSKPIEMTEGEWHCPFLRDDEWILMRQACITQDLETVEKYKKLSVARCARVSYLTHENKIDEAADLKLCQKLIAPPGDADENIMHASPFEHVAQACSDNIQSGPFIGWKQYRKEFRNENG